MSVLKTLYNPTTFENPLLLTRSQYTPGGERRAQETNGDALCCATKAIQQEECGSGSVAKVLII